VSTAVTPATQAPTSTKGDVTPAANALDCSAAIGKDPQGISETDLVGVPQAPGLDDPTRGAWEDSCLAAVNEKLKTWTGTTDSIVGSGIVFSVAKVGIGEKDWPVIASYWFDWNGQRMLTKAYVFNDGQGNKIPIFVTNTIPSSPWFDANLGYKNPSELNDSTGYFEIGLAFEWTDTEAKIGFDEFAASFFTKSKNFLWTKCATSYFGWYWNTSGYSYC